MTQPPALRGGEVVGVKQLLKRLLQRLNRKFARILFLLLSRHKSAASLGAVVGFALSIIFTWRRFLRQRKIKGPAVTDDASSTTRSYRDQELGPVDYQLSTNSKLFLQQTVKKKLNGGRKMTCRLLGVILEERSPGELQDHATVRASVVDVLVEISRYCDIYLMERTLDDESGEKVISALENAKLFRFGSLMKDKVLFCSTENGISSFVRQLEPDWHLETNLDVLFQLTKFVRYQLYISAIGSGSASGSNIITSTIFVRNTIDGETAEAEMINFKKYGLEALYSMKGVQMGYEILRADVSVPDSSWVIFSPPLDEFNYLAELR